MITKKTFATMIVPSIAPTWMYAARALNSWLQPQAATVVSAITATARTSWLGIARQSAS